MTEAEAVELREENEKLKLALEAANGARDDYKKQCEALEERLQKIVELTEKPI